MENEENRLKGKKNQFYRLLISFNDFKEALDIARIIFDKNNIDIEINTEKRKIDILTKEALSSALIVAYSRPFSGNDKSSKNSIPDLNKNVIKILNTNEKELHNSLIKLRNKAIAHSDSDIIDIKPYYMSVNNKKLDLLIPLRNKTRLTFSNEMLLNIEMICSKLLGEIDKRRRILEKELENFIPIKEIGVDNFDFPFNIES
tara:strand:+ start:470 stop:1075 length:606 start_codon:yes stop_codon:yes gene_type:complete